MYIWPSVKQWCKREKKIASSAQRLLESEVLTPDLIEISLKDGQKLFQRTLFSLLNTMRHRIRNART